MFADSYRFVCLFVVFVLFVCLLLYLFVYSCICFVCLFTLAFVCLFIHVFVCLVFVCLFVCLFRFESELGGVVDGVGEWWGGCEEMCQWLGEAEESLIAHKPLASSLNIIQQQKNSVQVYVGNTHNSNSSSNNVCFASRHVVGACGWDECSEGVV